MIGSHLCYSGCFRCYFRYCKHQYEDERIYRPTSEYLSE